MKLQNSVQSTPDRRAPEGAGAADTGRPSGQAPSPIVRQTGLTNRQLVVLRLIGRGWRSGDTACTPKRSVNTVEAHRANIKRKLGLASATELARFAFAALEAATDEE